MTADQPDDPLRRYRRPSPALLPTPFIEVDEKILMRNLSRVQERARTAGVALRPHLKTHKSIEIARRQIAGGAVGLTASKPSEALVFIDAGFTDVTLAFPVVDAAAVEPLAALAKARAARVRYIVADVAGIRALETAGARLGVQMHCYLKVDVGLGRVGIKPLDPRALELAAMIAANPALGFAGLLSHAGHAYGARDGEELHEIAAREASDLALLRDRLLKAGIDVPGISTGSTPTALGAPIAEGIDEIRPGNYAFLDLTALRLGICGPEDLALSVVARVVALNGSFAIVDAGSKALSSDLGPHGTGASGFGSAVATGDATRDHLHPVERLSEEHGFVAWDNTPPAVGSLIRIFPNHSCAVAAQFDSFVLRSESGDFTRVSIDARGRFA